MVVVSMNNKGLTLIELLLTLIIASMVGTAITGFLINAINNYNESQIRAGLQNELQFIESHLKSNIKNARKIVIDPSAPNKIGLVLSYTNSNEMSFYEVTKPTLLFIKNENGSSSSILLSTNISKFIIETKEIDSNLKKNEVKYTIVIESKYKGENITYSIVEESLLMPEWR